MKRPRAATTIVGALMIGVSYGMATAVDHGLTHGWTSSARSLWAIGLIALLLCGILMVAVGLGMLSSENLAAMSESSTKAPSLSQFIAVYVGFLVLGVGGANYLEETFGIKGPRAIFVICGTIFLLASTSRPWWLFGTLRRLGWFALISSDRAMRMLLAAIGLVLVAVGISARWGAT